MYYAEPRIDFPHAVEPPTVLVVENDPVTRDLLKAILEAAGFSYEGARDSQEALSIINRGHSTIGLILSDFQMPKLDGLQLLKMLKKTPKAKNIPFVLLTGATSVSLRKRAMLAGAVAILHKPFNLLEFFQILNRAINSQDDILALSKNPVEVKERVSCGGESSIFSLVS